MTLFKISSEPIEAAPLKAQLADARAGASVIFEGWVRNHNEGQAVASLAYEAYPILAEKEGRQILKEAVEKFNIIEAIAIHREGHLAIGDLAVWVGVAAAHRGDAFGASRYIIDETKARVPIWKKEYYATGTSQWINCATRGDATLQRDPVGNE